MSYALSSKTAQSPQRQYKGLLSLAALYRPVGSGTAGHETAAVPEGGTVSRVSTNLVGPIGGLCGLPTREGIGPDQLQRTESEKYNARRRKRPSTMHRRKYPSATHGVRGGGRGFAAAPTVFEVCSFRLKDSSVTSVTVQKRFSGAAVFLPRRLEEGGARQRSRPRGRNSVPRCNEHSRTVCGALRP
jgi:hypothetical protein